MVDIVQVPFPLLHAFREFLSIFDHTALDHLTQQVVTLAGTLAHSGEHRETVVSFGNIVDELLNQHRLAHTGTAEQTDLTTLHVGLQEVHYLDTGEQDLLRDGQVVELWSRLMNAAQVIAVQRAEHVDGFAHYVQQTPLDLRARRHRNGSAKIAHLDTAAYAVRALHCHAASRILADVLLHFKYQLLAVVAKHLQRRIDRRYLVLATLERYIDHRAYDLNYST